MSDSKKGDVVQLKSGGPRMTVADVGDYSGMGMGPKEGVNCDWFEKNQRKNGLFDAATLRKCEDEVS